MTKKVWKTRIKKACKDAGTYQTYFDSVIDTLADILEKRDQANKQYIDEGSEACIEYTNKNGSTNMVKNPILQTVNEFNASALTYWRDLGLTPAGLKKINETALKNNKKDSFTDTLSKIFE